MKIFASPPFAAETTDVDWNRIHYTLLRWLSELTSDELLPFTDSRARRRKSERLFAVPYWIRTLFKASTGCLCKERNIYSRSYRERFTCYCQTGRLRLPAAIGRRWFNIQSEVPMHGRRNEISWKCCTPVQCTGNLRLLSGIRRCLVFRINIWLR